MGYKDDCEKIGNDIKENEAKRETQRQEELKKVEDELDATMKKLEDQREQEKERQEAEEKRKQEALKAESSAKQRAFERNREREHRHLRDMFEKQEKATQNHMKILRKQKEFYSTEQKNKSETNQKRMLDKEKKLKDEAEEASQKVEDLKEKKQQAHDELNEKLEEYHKKHLENQDRYHNETVDLLQKETNVILEREQKKMVHQEKIHCLTMSHAVHEKNVVVKIENDRTERSFVNSVLNARETGTNLINSVMALGANAYRLKKDKSPDPKVVQDLKTAIEHDVNVRMTLLRFTASSIRDEQESNNKATLDSQNVAVEINDALLTLQNSLAAFTASLDDDPVENARELYKQVVEDCKEVGKKVSSLPQISMSNHAIGAIVENTKRLALSGKNVQKPQILEIED